MQLDSSSDGHLPCGLSSIKDRPRGGCTGSGAFIIGALWVCGDPQRRLLYLQIKFTINFDYNLQQAQDRAEVKFEAKR